MKQLFGHGPIFDQDIILTPLPIPQIKQETNSDERVADNLAKQR
jgi:hypothetical protein